MNARILHIGVLDIQGQVHAVSFKKGVNVVTGRSSTGKSALIEIFDFCFGSSDFTVPVGVITDCADLYFTVMKVNESALVLARRSKDTRVFLKEELDLQRLEQVDTLNVDYFDDDYFSPLSDFLKELKRYFGVVVTDIDEDLAARGWRGAKSSTPSARSFTSFMLQHQNLVANKHAIFYRFDQKEKREQAIDHLKIFLGFADQTYFIKSQELNVLLQEQRLLERSIPRREGARDTAKSKLLNALREYEAISGKTLIDDLNNAVTHPKPTLRTLREAKVEVVADINQVKKAAAVTSPELTDKIIYYFVDHGMQILTAIILMGLGVIIARWVGNLVHRWLKSKAYDEPVSNLIVKVVKLLIIGFIGVMALGQMGVQITPLIAGIGVAGVGVSLAMQGILGNLVAGLTIIFSKPFTIGEYIELLGVYGQVTDIALFSTTLLHTDNSRVIVPNRKIVGEILHNYGYIRQLDLTAVIGYSADLTTALSIVNEILQQNSNVLTEPPPVVGIAALNESSIALAIKPWVKVENFVPAQAAIYQAVIENFRGRKIEIPVARRDIHILNPLP